MSLLLVKENQEKSREENCEVSGEETESIIYQSRWGYHAISKESYVLLKRLYKAVWFAWYAHKRLERYFRKRVRTGNKPEVDNNLTLYSSSSWKKNGMSQYLKSDNGKYVRKQYDTFRQVEDDYESYGLFFNPIAMDIVDSFWKVKRPCKTIEEAKEVLSKLSLATNKEVPFEQGVNILCKEWGLIL